MMHVLLCTKKRERYIMLKDILQQQDMTSIRYANCKEETQELLSMMQLQVCILDLPFCDDQQELSYAYSLKKHYPEMSLLVMCGKSAYAQVKQRLSSYGIFVLSKPLELDIFTQVLSFIKVNAINIQSYQSSQRDLLSKIETIKLVDRAKCALMENEYLSEEKAHRLIEKRAMDERKSRSVIAQEILREFEDI